MILTLPARDQKTRSASAPGLRPEIKRIIEALARDTVAREDVKYNIAEQRPVAK